MKSKKSNSVFDCVAFKGQAQESIYEDIKELTAEQEIAYFEERAKSGNLGRWWRQVKSGARSTTAGRRRSKRQAA